MICPGYLGRPLNLNTQNENHREKLTQGVGSHIGKGPANINFSYSDYYVGVLCQDRVSSRGLCLMWYGIAISQVPHPCKGSQQCTGGPNGVIWVIT